MASKRFTVQDAQRTGGDGIDNALIALHDANLLKPSEHIMKSLKPVEPKGKVINLVPKYVPSNRKQPKYLTAKPKDPKFVPYEPYKGAVEPILPKERKPVYVERAEAASKDKNNIDIQDLVQQMSEMRTIDLNKAKIEAIEKDELLIPKTQWEEEKIAYENDIKNLRETNAHLENQLKFQAQVNSELKTLLVAAVGEDLESRVQHLTEAKLILAKELLNSAYNLTSHQEHTEWLSGQCEVWRSKFLASSLMVEELARWKSALSNRVTDLQETLKELLEERTKIRTNEIRSYNNLKQIENHLKVDFKETNLKTINILHVSEVINKQTENIAAEILGQVNKNIPEEILAMPSNTKVENIALRLLKNPVSLTSKPDMACKAVMNSAFSLGGGQMFLQHPSTHATCCSHCKGDIQDI